MDRTELQKQYDAFLNDVQVHGVSYMTNVGKRTAKLMPGDEIPEWIRPGFVPAYRTLNRKARKETLKNREKQRR